MRGKLILEDDGWRLLDTNDNEVWSSDYPLREDEDFRQEVVDRLIDAEGKYLELDKGNAPDFAASQKVAKLAHGASYEKVDHRTVEELE